MQGGWGESVTITFKRKRVRQERLQSVTSERTIGLTHEQKMQKAKRRSSSGNT